MPLPLEPFADIPLDDTLLRHLLARHEDRAASLRRLWGYYRNPQVGVDGHRARLAQECGLPPRQTGRLIGASEADLWAQVALIQSRCESLLTGALIDNGGTTWTAMTLLEFAPEPVADRGRAISLAYAAVYARLL